MLILHLCIGNDAYSTFLFSLCLSFCCMCVSMQASASTGSLQPSVHRMHSRSCPRRRYWIAIYLKRLISSFIRRNHWWGVVHSLSLPSCWFSVYRALPLLLVLCAFEQALRLTSNLMVLSLPRSFILKISSKTDYSPCCLLSSSQFGVTRIYSYQVCLNEGDIIVDFIVQEATFHWHTPLLCVFLSLRVSTVLARKPTLPIWTIPFSWFPYTASDINSATTYIKTQLLPLPL